MSLGREDDARRGKYVIQLNGVWGSVRFDEGVIDGKIVLNKEEVWVQISSYQISMSRQSLTEFIGAAQRLLLEGYNSPSNIFYVGHHKMEQS